jgi:choline dehydrogenase-like flavoprotein
VIKVCDRVDGFPCPLGAKADAEWAVIRPALAAHPNLTLMTRTTVERLTTDGAGRSVTGVAVTLPDGSPHSIDFWLSSEDIPLADSRITLRPDGAMGIASW